MIRLIVPVFALAITLSAGLLFNIQPMIGKMLLPLVGGAPAVWNVAMAFFQMALLLGYLVAHLLTRLSPTRHGLVYLGGLLLASTFLPIALPPGWRPDLAGSVPLALLGVLIVTVGLPFVALSLSAPTLQRLFAHTTHPRARDPYFLYAASNLGSFAGLLAYPLWLEAHYSLPEQAALWQTGFTGLIGLVAVALILRGRMAPPATSASESPTIHAPPSALPRRTYAVWVLLAFIPSSLTLGVTQYVTTDIAATPMLWVATLSLYLLTFVLAFREGKRTVTRHVETAFPFLAALALALTLFPLKASWEALLLHLLAFGATAFACHSRLAASRPAPAHLTAYFFWISVGGALGGAFNAFLAPLLFNQFAEYTLVLGLALAVTRPVLPPGVRSGLVALVLVAMVRFGLDLAHIADVPGHHNLSPALLLTALTLGLLELRKHTRVLLEGLTVVTTGFFLFSTDLFTGRDFFGVIRVKEMALSDTSPPFRVIFHGSTIHGLQHTDPARRTQTTGYYSSRSPIAGVFAAYATQNVLIVGLGAGGLNCFARPGQRFHFVEIDPLMVSVAQEWFTFLRDCPPPRITVGDGRLVMESEAAQGLRYDLIVLDAFSSDSVPTHLLTTEALQTALSLLTPQGVLVVHVSSRFFRLAPLLSATAHALNLAGLRGYVEENDLEAADGPHFSSTWVALARDEADLAPLRQQPGWGPLPAAAPDLRPWTDSYSNLWQVLITPGDNAADPSAPRQAPR